MPLYFRESPYHFDSRFFRIPEHAYIEGYWQSEKYFKDIEPIIRKEFTFRDDLDEQGQEMGRKIAAVNAVCLNVRRGDFVSNPVANQHHGACEIDYFSAAVRIVAGKVQTPHLFIFSDDIDWCYQNLHFDYPFTIVGHEYAGEKFGQYLQLMIRCKHYIIPNSSFGWWAAWLNPNPGKIVVAPKQWYRNPRFDTSHLIPDSWIKI